jgi:hypothetical protein
MHRLGKGAAFRCLCSQSGQHRIEPASNNVMDYPFVGT